MTAIFCIRPDMSQETPLDSKPTTTVKVEGSSLQIGYFAYDALRVSPSLKLAERPH